MAFGGSLPQINLGVQESEPDNFIWQEDGVLLDSVRDWLKIIVPDQWIGRKGPHDKAYFAYPPSSPDLTTCDFYLRGIIKDCVYLLPQPADLPNLRHRIEAAVARITSNTLNKVRDELAYRLDVCRVTNEARIEHL
ncbi:uncharacterized protein TNCV_2301231 [Trichonephila clavipes]|nr:uncharacterized protein TNCV_2301231 [Trichonephila clavipes]